VQRLEELIANLNKSTETAADINMEGFVQLDRVMTSLGTTMTSLVTLQTDILDILKTQTNTMLEQQEQTRDDRLRGDSPARRQSPPIQKEDSKPGLGTGLALGAALKNLFDEATGLMATRATKVAKGAGIAALAGIPAYAIGRGVFGREPDSDYNPTQGYGFNPQLGFDPGRSGTYDGVMDPAKGFDRFAAGATSGAVVGAGLGSIVPGVGTALGGIVGSLVGGIGNYLLSPSVEKKLNEGLDKFIDSVEGFFKDGDMRLREEANELKNLELLNFELDGIKARTAEFDESGRIGEMGYLSSLKQRVKDAERKPQAEVAKAQTEETLGEIAVQQMDISYAAMQEKANKKERVPQGVDPLNLFGPKSKPDTSPPQDGRRDRMARTNSARSREAGLRKEKLVTRSEPSLTATRPEDVGDLGLVTSSGGRYTTEEIFDVLRTAVKNKEIPDFEALTAEKATDVMNRPYDSYELGNHIRAMGFSPMKVPDASAVRALSNAVTDGPPTSPTSFQAPKQESDANTNETPITRSKQSFAEFREQQGQPKGYDPVTGRPLSGGTGVVSKPKPLLDRVISFFSNDEPKRVDDIPKRVNNEPKRVDDIPKRVDDIPDYLEPEDVGDLGLVTSSSGRYTTEEIFDVLRTAAKNEQIPDFSALTAEKATDVMNRTSDAGELEDHIRKMGFSPMKVPDASAVRVLSNAVADEPRIPPSPSPTQSVVPLTSPTSFQAPKQESMGGGNVIAPVNAPTNNSVTNNTITGKPRSYADSARGATGNTADLYT